MRPAPVPEEDQFLAEDPGALRQLAELRRGRHRLPEAAHELPARGAGPDVGELRVLPRQPRVVVSAIGRVGVDFAHGSSKVRCVAAREFLAHESSAMIPARITEKGRAQ